MQRVPGGGLQPWSPAPLADTLSLALCLLLLGCLHCALAMSPCKEDEYPVGAECCPKCKPGYRVNKPCGKDTGMSCAPSGRGTYTAHLNDLSECLQCQVCDPAMGLVTRRRCFSTNNTVCGCDQGHFCVTEEGDDCTECRPHRVCGPGQRVQERGTERQDTECADCPPGTFSPDGTLAKCLPWTQCSGPFQTETEPGTESTDATCSSWGFYMLCVFIVFGVIVALVLVLWRTVKSRRSCGLCAPTRARLQVEEDAATRPSRLSPACCSPSEPQLPVRGTGLLTPPPGLVLGTPAGNVTCGHPFCQGFHNCTFFYLIFKFVKNKSFSQSASKVCQSPVARHFLRLVMALGT